MLCSYFILASSDLARSLILLHEIWFYTCSTNHGNLEQHYIHSYQCICISVYIHTYICVFICIYIVIFSSQIIFVLKQSVHTKLHFVLIVYQRSVDIILAHIRNINILPNWVCFLFVICPKIEIARSK